MVMLNLKLKVIKVKLKLKRLKTLMGKLIRKLIFSLF